MRMARGRLRQGAMGLQAYSSSANQIRSQRTLAYGRAISKRVGTSITNKRFVLVGLHMRGLHDLEELMKYFTHTLALTGLIASLGTGAIAQDVDPATVTCGDFMAMSAEDQSLSLIHI